MNMQQPYTPSFYSSQIYRSPTAFRFLGSPHRNLMPSVNVNMFEDDENVSNNEPKDKNIKPEEKSSENGSDEVMNNNASKESSSGNTYAGRRRSFNEMMEDDLVPEFDVNGMFDEQELSENITSTFL